MPRPWLRQASAYLVFGLVQLAVDTGIFIGLTAAGVALTPANVIGRLAGAGLGFMLNGRVTFAAPGQGPLHGLALARFALLWLVMTIIGSALLRAVEHKVGLHGSWYAKPLVEALLAVLGFLAMKFFVFRSPRVQFPTSDR